MTREIDYEMAAKALSRSVDEVRLDDFAETPAIALARYRHETLEAKRMVVSLDDSVKAVYAALAEVQSQLAASAAASREEREAAADAALAAKAANLSALIEQASNIIQAQVRLIRSQGESIASVDRRIDVLDERIEAMKANAAAFDTKLQQSLDVLREAGALVERQTTQTEQLNGTVRRLLHRLSSGLLGRFFNA